MTDSAPTAPLATAQLAMRHWIAGAAGGDWIPLIAMLDPAVAFHVPVAGFPGVRNGLDEARRFFGQLSEAVRAQLGITSTMTGDGGRVAFEVAVHGQWHERPFVQALCLVFVVNGDRVIEFGEYLAWPGGLDPL